MRLTFNVRDWDAKGWDGFWRMTIDQDTPIERFGFRMCVVDIHTSATRIATACKERMDYARRYLRDEERELRKMSNYQMVHDCKSHRAIKNARKQLEHTRDLNNWMIDQINDLI